MTLTKAEQRPDVGELCEQLGIQGLLELDPVTGTACQVAKLEGYLTPPSGDSPEDIVRDQLCARPDVFRLSDAMELSPANPCFLDQRNAILQDHNVVNYGDPS
ncbi:hypothetical protein [Streptomyces griseorubiginosus]|uniref:hypothetical protein n=1 Tax=Streptomyces griseorubiginosus TaxID=67304 RepID=UPI00365F86AE